MPYVQKKVITEGSTSVLFLQIVYTKCRGKHADFDIAKSYFDYFYLPAPDLFLLKFTFIVLCWYYFSCKF